MFQILISKKGFFEKEKGEWVPIVSSLSYYLHHFPKFEKGLTVWDFMKVLMQHEADINLLFMAYSRGFTLKPFWKEMNTAPAKTEEASLDTIVFEWAADVYNEKEFGKPKLSISDSIHVSGRMKKEKKVNYSLSFVQLNTLKKTRLKTDTTYTVDYYKMPELWEDKRGERISFFKGIKMMTLRDVVGAWLNEISFFGYPESRNEKAQEVLHRSENVKNEKTTPMEMVLLKWKKKQIKRLRKNKNTAKNEKKIAKTEKEIQYLKKKLKQK